MRYQPTILVSSIGNFEGIKPGQWVQIETGARGQYLGHTKTGVVVIRWQNGKFCQETSMMCLITAGSESLHFQAKHKTRF